MSELERLTEAIEQADHYKMADPDNWVFLLLEAARAYRDLLANGQRVEWCETHQRSAPPCGARMNCSIVSKLLSVYPKEAESP